MKETNKVLAREWVRQSALVALLLVASVAQSKAQSYNLSTGGTSLQINAGTPNPGLSNWLVGGADELNQQWFYYSVGGGNVNSIDTISPWSLYTQTGSTLSGAYSNSTLSVTTFYSLNNVSQNSSTLAELTTQVALQNLSGATQSFNFYQYSDFTIGGAAGGQDVEFTGTGFPYTVYQYNPSNLGIGFLTGTIDIGPGTTVEEMAGTSTMFGLVNGQPSPSFNNTLTAGPGVVDFGYEFTATLAPDASITFSELQTVPEPSSVALISSGMLAVGLFYKRKK
jgi:hypothetical protein